MTIPSGILKVPGTVTRYQGTFTVVFCITINTVLAWQVSLQIWTHWCHNEWDVVYPYKYINHIAGECENRLVSQLRNYVEYKVYKSCFGDILPCVLTRALGTDLLILNKASSGYFCNFISKSEDSVCTLPLLILVRNDEHYDAIVYLRNTHRMIWLLIKSWWNIGLSL